MALQDFFSVASYRAGVSTPVSPETLIKLRNFRNDTLPYDQSGDQDLTYIEIGFRKPWRQVYFDLSGPVALPGVGRSEFFFTYGSGYHHSPSGAATEFLNDETGFLRNSGFITIKEIPPLWRPDDLGLYSLLIWCSRTDTSVDPGWTLPIRGINYIFSDDNDLQRVRSDILEANDGAGWGPKHVLARDFIMAKLRRKFADREISAFDILNPWELREASTFLTLSMIYKYELSKMPGDLFDAQAKSFYEKAEKSFDAYELAIDTNDDGEFDSDDTQQVGDDQISGIDLEWT